MTLASFPAVERMLTTIYDAHTQACNVDASKNDLFLSLIDSVGLTTADSIRSLNERY